MKILIITKEKCSNFGANREGREILSILYQSFNYNPILFFEEDNSIIGTEINGLKVYSLDNNLDLISKFNIDLLLITSETHHIK